MAKVSGGTRVSRWVNRNNSQEKLYFRDGVRVEYAELDSLGKRLVKDEKNKVAKELYAKLKNEKTTQLIDNGQIVQIGYTSKGCDHFANDAMLTLSGKYFSRNSMMRVNEILAKSTYIPTSHNLIHSRTDGRDFWSTYTDADGRGVYFKVCWNNQLKMHELYSVTDYL